MQKNLSRRLGELSRLVDYFKQENFKETANQIELASQSLSNGRSPDDVLKGEFIEAYRSLESKFVQGDGFRKLIFSQISDILVLAILNRRGKIA